jgi:hypothetical protein
VPRGIVGSRERAHAPAKVKANAAKQEAPVQARRAHLRGDGGAIRIYHGNSDHGPPFGGAARNDVAGDALGSGSIAGHACLGGLPRLYVLGLLAWRRKRTQAAA